MVYDTPYYVQDTLNSPYNKAASSFNFGSAP